LMKLSRDGGKIEIMKKKKSFLKSAIQAILILIAFITISITIGFCVGKQDSAKSNKAPTQSQSGLASHQVIKKTDEETTVSYKHIVSLMVDKDIKRQELKSLLLHYMNERVSARTTKKFVLFVYAYTDPLRYKRGEQWIGMLEFNEFQNSTPRITFDEINLFDGALKKAEVNDPLREKMFFDVSGYDYEATLIMEDKYPMSTNDQITYLQNDRNRNEYIAEVEATKDKLIRYYMKKHALTRSQFDALYAEGNEKNWTKKSVEESKKIKSVYRGFM